MHLLTMRRFIVGIVSVLALVSCAGKQEHSIELKSEADLSGLRVATLAGSCYDMELSAREDISLQLFNLDSDVLQALVNNKADVAVEDEVVYNAEVRKENGVKVALLGDQAFPTAIMFRKEDTVLAQTLSAVQRRMEEDGSMQRLKDFWLTDRFAQEKNYTHIPDETGGTPIRVASASDSAPISFMMDGEWYGIEIDLLRELGKELHRPLEIKHYDSSSMMLALRSGLVDALCGCIFVTHDREEEFQFADS